MAIINGRKPSNDPVQWGYQLAYTSARYMHIDSIISVGPFLSGLPLLYEGAQVSRCHHGLSDSDHAEVRSRVQ